MAGGGADLSRCVKVGPMSRTRDLSVSLERTPCYGPCPVYTVTLRGDGTAAWHGEHSVEPLGRHTGEVDPNDVKRLVAFARKVSFFDWDPEYVEQVTDHPGTRVTIQTGPDETHSVLQYATNKPREFWTLSTLIDGVRALITWEPEDPFEALVP